MEFVKIDGMHVAGLTSYIQNAAGHDVSAPVKQMYMNQEMVCLRFQNNMELGIAAMENGRMIGEITAISPNRDENWTVVTLHVEEASRRKGCATKLMKCLEKELLNQYEAIKCSVSFCRTNKIASSCFILNDYELEGKIRALRERDDMIIMGKLVA